MKILFIILSVILILIILLLIAVKPNRRRYEMKKFVSPVRYAHRGLHDKNLPENSLAAFAAAVERGYGIELDVRTTKDGKLVVFHDSDLKRMTGAEGEVSQMTLAELKELRLDGTQERIPTFEEALSLIDGEVPLLVEIKRGFEKSDVEEKTVAVLKKYKGEYIIESFNPLTVREIKKNLPHICRGILSFKFLRGGKFKGIVYFALQNLFFNFLAKPDFIAYHHKDYKNIFFQLDKRLFRATAIAWTITSPEEEKEAFKHGFDAVIFENYIPEE